MEDTGIGIRVHNKNFVVGGNYWKRPIGRPKSLITRSFLKTSTPKLTNRWGLCVYGKEVLLAANPWQLRTTTGTFFIVFANVTGSRSTCPEVFFDWTISSRGMMCAGLSIRKPLQKSEQWKQR